MAASWPKWLGLTHLLCGPPHWCGDRTDRRLVGPLVGAEGELTAVHGERDRNFRIDASRGRYLLKVHNPRTARRFWTSSTQRFATSAPWPPIFRCPIWFRPDRGSARWR